MIESDIWKHKESLYRQSIIDRDNEIHRLKQEIETLKNQNRTYIGFHQPSTSSMEMAFPNTKFKGGD